MNRPGLMEVFGPQVGESASEKLDLSATQSARRRLFKQKAQVFDLDFL